MIALHVRYRFRPEDVAEAVRCFTGLQAATRQEDGCLAYTAYRADDYASFWLHEEWESTAHLEAHFTTEHFQRYSVDGLQKLATVREITRGEPVAP
jgi:quinol monooxygenase YgiN